MATEKLNFKLELFATYHDVPPYAEVLINDTSYFKDFIKGTKEKPTIIQFQHDATEGLRYALKIQRSGKKVSQTVVEDGKIVKDQILHINAIEIDDISIGNLIFEGVYTPEYSRKWYEENLIKGTTLPHSYKNSKDLGYNGLWNFEFSSPFYMWLLDNLY